MFSIFSQNSSWYLQHIGTVVVVLQQFSISYLSKLSFIVTSFFSFTDTPHFILKLLFKYWSVETVNVENAAPPMVSQ